MGIQIDHQPQTTRFAEDMQLSWSCMQNNGSSDQFQHYFHYIYTGVIINLSTNIETTNSINAKLPTYQKHKDAKYQQNQLASFKSTSIAMWRSSG